MKKIILIFLSLSVISAGLFLSCKKISVNQLNNVNYVQSKIDAIVASCPPGNSSCNADCLFTGCSACWDPKIYEGGCGCYHGFSECKTEKKPSASARTLSNNITRTTYVQPQKISEYFKYLET